MEFSIIWAQFLPNTGGQADLYLLSQK